MRMIILLTIALATAAALYLVCRVLSLLALLGSDLSADGEVEANESAGPRTEDAVAALSRLGDRDAKASDGSQPGQQSPPPPLP
ncbi:MAG TPA: hypothetical protein V6D08_15025 [Candidatus Obscuribacterales bacterium]